jgi:hypothetical protein
MGQKAMELSMTNTQGGRILQKSLLYLLEEAGCDARKKEKDHMGECSI